MIGLTISHYHIENKIGGGGMGVVYRARDLKLGRLVALKFLSDSLHGDSRALDLLAREARAASALNHPNICTVYEINEYNGQSFIAMELLEGETLRQRIAAGPLPVELVMNLTAQILDALEAVHSNGIVHRDLKPENIFITASGQLKLLDFGLAKVRRSPRPPTNDTIPLKDFVDTEPDNQKSLAGTFGYMAPEQVRNETLGPETDLFSLGAVTYEMLAGQRAFSGTTPVMLLEAVLVKSPPEIRSLNPRVPVRLQKIVERLLEKDRTSRYQSASAVRADILLANRDAAGTRRSWQTPAAILAAGAVLSAVLYFSLSDIADNESPSLSPLPNMTLTQLTSQPGQELFPTVAPGGGVVVYASPASGNWDLFSIRVGGQNPINLTGDSAADETQPAFSPSGDLIAFRSERDGGGIYVMGATGESVRRLTDFGFNPAWSPDGREIVVAEERVTDNPNNRQTFSRLRLVDAASGESRFLEVEDAVQPHWSPHGYRIAYWARSKAGRRDVWTIRADGTDVRQVTNDDAVDWNPAWDPSGRFLYFSSDRGGSMNLWRVAIDEASGEILGAPQPVTSGAGQRHHTSISSDGRHIAYVEQVTTENIRRSVLDLKSKRLVGPADVITKGSREARNPNPRADGQWIAFQSWGQQEDIYIVRADGTGERYLTNDVAKDRVPRWSPDGQHIAFYSNRSGNFEIWVINQDGSGLKQLTNDQVTPNSHSVWSPDGRSIAGFQPERGSFILELDDDINVKARNLLPPFPEDSAFFDVWSWSPDGKFLAGGRVTSSGEYRGVIVYSVESKTYQLVTDYGDRPAWLASSNELLFMNDSRAYLLDIRTKRTDDLGPISDLSQLSPDNRFVYFTVTERESDVWLIELNKQ